MSKAYKEGYKAFGERVFNNPYQIGSNDEWDWEQGWMDAFCDYSD